MIHRLQDDNQVRLMRKLAIDYVNFIKECWVHASVVLHFTRSSLSLMRDLAATNTSP